MSQLLAKTAGKKKEKRNSCIITQGPNNSITILRRKAFRFAKKPAKEELGFTSPITMSITKRQARKLNKISNSCETSCNRRNCSFRFKTNERKKTPQQEHGSHFPE
jgi:hypothetical protein